MKERVSVVRVIVNADDFGYSTMINQRIVDLVGRGCVTSATLLANAPAVEDAVSRISRVQKCSLGVHLNLTEFEPLTPCKNRADLAECLNAQGAFCGEEALRRIRVNSVLRKAILNELSLQVEKILSLGVKVTHFDSHNHIHTIPGMFLVLKQLQKRFNIRKVRTTWNIYTPDVMPSRITRFKKRLWHLALRRFYSTKTTDGFGSFRMFFEQARNGCLKHELIEVEVHPGHQTYDFEAQLLEGGWQNVIPCKVRQISYEDI